MSSSEDSPASSLFESDSQKESEKPEVIAAVSELTAGASLLKATKKGKHFRQFQLSKDLNRLFWDSPRKECPGVLISEISDIVFGQTTPVFKKNPVPEYEALSFSLLYSNKSLDLICSSKEQFITWTTAIKALMGGFRDIDAITAHNSRGRKTLRQSKVEVKVGTIKAKVKVKDEDCDLYTWGSGDCGVLGHGENDNESAPKVVESLLGRNIVHFAMGQKHMMAVSDKGEVFSWGSGLYGRLGQGHIRDRFAPLLVGPPLRGHFVTKVACNEFHSAAITDTGELYTWGRAGPHLGYELEVTKQPKPTLVQALAGVKIESVACGMGHTVVTSIFKEVFVFGENGRGQLGTGNNKTTWQPQRMEFEESILALKPVCGKYHTAILTCDGRLFIWGGNDRGQLGSSDNIDKNLPTEVTFENFLISDVSCGDLHTAALTSTYIVYCWGDNEFQQLGLNKDKNKYFSIPTAVTTPSGHQIQQVACGSNFTAVLTKNKENPSVVFTWGCNAKGQLGLGDFKLRAIPAKLDFGDKELKSIVCGGQHMSCSVLHKWVPDEEAPACMACRKNFTPVRRRHHCRKCGGVFCGSCTTKRFPLLHIGLSEPVRVCDRCYATLTAENAAI